MWIELSYRYHTPVRLLQEVIDAEEFHRLAVYEEIEPHGLQRMDLGFGIVAATVYNVNRGRGPRRQVRHFMPQYMPQRRIQDPKEMEKRFRAFAAAHNRKLGLSADGRHRKSGSTGSRKDSRI